MTPQDKIKLVANLAIIIGAVCIALFTPMPTAWAVGLFVIVVVCVACPSSVPALLDVLANAKAPPPATTQPRAAFDAVVDALEAGRGKDGDA